MTFRIFEVVLKMKKVFLNQMSWQCGDGCCSNSWIDADLCDESGRFIKSAERLALGWISSYEDSELKELVKDVFGLEDPFEIL